MNTTTLPQPKVRNSNLELYRILVMLAIVVHHYVVSSGLMSLMEADPLNSKSIFLYIIGMWGKTGINCFVLITGYFMCKSEITLRKFLKLILEIECYNILIFLFFVVIDYGNITVKEFAFQILPIKSITDKFVDCYLVFFLFIPFLNVLVRNINRRQHQLLLILCLSVFSFLSLMPNIVVKSNYVLWFCILFFIGSYLRNYPYKDGNVWYWSFLSLIFIALSILSVVTIIILNKYGIHVDPYILISDSNAPLAVLVSICSFMLFKNLRIKQNKFINVVGGGTFGVLLIHANCWTMRKWLWQDICDNIGQYATDTIYIHAIIVPLLVFIACSLIEYVRMKIIEASLLNSVYNYIRKYYPEVQ